MALEGRGRREQRSMRERRENGKTPGWKDKKAAPSRPFSILVEQGGLRTAPTLLINN